jgi:hypothetical protein
MRAVAKIDDEQIAKMTLDITFRMTVGEWRELMRQMPTREWPSHDMGRHISAVLGHLAKATSTTFTDPLHEADPKCPECGDPLDADRPIGRRFCSQECELACEVQVNAETAFTDADS